MKQTRADLIGKKFGKLTVIEFSHLDKFRHAHWICKCDCGGKRTTCSRQLIGGRTKSCGCIPRLQGKRNKNWKGFGDLSLSFFHAIRNDALRRNLIFNITIEECWNLFIKQDRKCKLSGLPLVFRTKTTQFDGNASMDRIDSSNGYTIDNIQWVHKDVNKMKWDLSPERFKELVKKIYENMGIKEIGTSLTLSR